MKHLIIGIDPGTTLGYAITELDGTVIKMGSSKQIGMSSLISETIKHGRPLICSCDKKNVPMLVQKYAASVGAVIVNPRHDLQVADKKELIKAIKIKPSNLHEADALSAALFAARKISALLHRIDKYISETKSMQHREKIIELVLLERTLSIKNAHDIILKSENNVQKAEKGAEENVFSEESFIKLHSRLKQQDNAINLLRANNAHLKSKLSKKEVRIRKIKVFDKSSEDKIMFKEKRLQQYQHLLESRNSQIDALKRELGLLNIFLSSLRNNLLIKKLKTLSYNEYSVKKSILNISDNDVLLVEDLSICSKRTVDELKEKVSVIIYRKDITKRMKDELPFTLLSADKLKLQEAHLFAIADKEQFLNAKDNSTMVSRIVEQYRKDRLDKH